MPAISPRQQRLMAKVSHDRNFAKEVKIPQSVGRKFDHYAEGGQAPDPMTDTSWLFDGYADGGRFREQVKPFGHDLQFFDYDPKPIPVSTSGIETIAPATPSPTNFAAPYVPPIFTPPDFGAASPGGAGNGIGGTQSTGGIGVGPSSVSGTGIGSIANNIGMGNAQGAIAALMGLAGMASPAVGVIGSLSSLANTLGLNGLTNGIAVSNDQSSNNVANDVGAIAAIADAMGIGENSAGPVSAEAAASSPGNAEGVGTGIGGVSPGDTGSGESWRRGGRIKASEYHRFKPQPLARGGRAWL